MLVSVLYYRDGCDPILTHRVIEMCLYLDYYFHSLTSGEEVLIPTASVTLDQHVLTRAAVPGYRQTI